LLQIGLRANIYLSWHIVYHPLCLSSKTKRNAAIHDSAPYRASLAQVKQAPHIEQASHRASPVGVLTLACKLYRGHPHSPARDFELVADQLTYLLTQTTHTDAQVRAHTSMYTHW
jgi:hypothetical protein